MYSILTVTEAASDPTLLTMEELRQATGIKQGMDAELASLNRRVAAAIASRCNVEGAGAAQPSLRLETLSRQFRFGAPVDRLLLRRRPVVEVISVTECDVALDASEYEVDHTLGALVRLCGGYPGWWWPGTTTVVFRAGWATVPENLRSAAMKLAAVLWSEGRKADPGLRREAIPGVIEREWWVGPSTDPLIPREIDDLLADYVYPAMG